MVHDTLLHITMNICLHKSKYYAVLVCKLITLIVKSESESYFFGELLVRYVSAYLICNLLTSRPQISSVPVIRPTLMKNYYQ